MTTEKNTTTEITLKHKLLKELVTIVGTVRDDVKLSFTADDLRIKAVDPSHVAMLDMGIPSSEFDTYAVDTDTVVAVDLRKFKDVLKLGKPDDIVTITVENTNLQLKMKRITRKLPLLDTKNISDVSTPALKFGSMATVPTNLLKEAVKASNLVADHTTMVLSKSALQLTAEDEIDSIQYTIDGDEISNVECGDNATSTYSLSYLAIMVNTICGKDTTIKIQNEYPLLMEFAVGKTGKVSYLLAPKIKE